MARKGMEDGAGKPAPAKSRDYWGKDDAPKGNRLIQQFLFAAAAEDFNDPWFLELLPEVIKCLQRYELHEARTLDEAFEAARPPGYRRAAAHNRATNKKAVQILGGRLRDAGAAVDEAFFKVIGNLRGVESTQAKDWYYEGNPSTAPRRFAPLPSIFQPFIGELTWVEGSALHLGKRKYTRNR
ncbi:hypothetical protein [Aerolutibacter ruishenii]|uniref:Uncharacterized protein n=1 Tax=Aerolutibacter ruishenii TaxID=686800 RepID=A0A562LYL5_9GAMM|nr:hypothetical protein [Lysobacter ruishenii]TWI12716.1 hypothetical protein IP93_01061 [Lysobacter ruishenii]